MNYTILSDVILKRPGPTGAEKKGEKKALQPDLRPIVKEPSRSGNVSVRKIGCIGLLVETASLSLRNASRLQNPLVLL